MFRALITLTAVLAVAGASPAFGDDANVSKSKKPRKKRASSAEVHTVARGDSLWTISRTYGCSLKEITHANDLTDEAMIHVGQTIKIPSCSGVERKRERAALATTTLRHVVASGETLSSIAKQYDTSIDSLRSRNRIDGSLIRPGQELVVVPGKEGRGRPIAGQSRGVPHHGKLIGGLQLPTSRLYHRRRPARSWGTSQLVHHVKRAAAVVAARHKTHKLAIGDISTKKGGHIAPHISHQSGRDIDIGFYFKKKPKGYPTSFVVGTAKNLDMKANWLLLQTLYNTRNQAGGVSKIFLDYDLQKVFYNWAKKRGVSTALLDKMFQYPNGGGIIRHESGHDDHYHVRFKCPPRDSSCDGD